MNRAGLGVGASLLARLPCKSTGLSLFFVYIPSTFRLLYFGYFSSTLRQFHPRRFPWLPLLFLPPVKARA